MAPVLLAPRAIAAGTTYVSFTFDDGRTSQFTNAFSEMAAKGVHGTFYINSNTIGVTNRISWNDAQTMAVAGNEIGGHTADHLKLTDPALTYDQVVQQVCPDRQAIVQHGFTAQSFAYPFGSWNRNFTMPDGTTKTVRDVIRDCGYQSGRAAGGISETAAPFAETVLPARDVYATRTQEENCVSGQTNCELLTASKLQSAVNATASHGGGWLQFVFHEVCDDADTTCLNSTWRPISRSEFGAFIDWLNASGQVGGAPAGTLVKTASEVINLPPPPPPPPPPPYRDQVLGTSGLLSYWRLGEATGTVAADSKGASNGAYQGGVALGAAGAVTNDPNTAATFNGTTSKVSLPSQATVTDFTIEGWTYLTNASSVNNTLYGALNNVRLLARPGSPNVSTGMYGGVWLNGTEYVLQPSTSQSNVNKWVQWAMTRSGNTLTLFRNGAQIGQRTDLPATAVANISGWIGAQGGSNYFLAGRVDDVSIYNRALTATEVANHYNGGVSGLAP